MAMTLDAFTAGCAEFVQGHLDLEAHAMTALVMHDEQHLATKIWAHGDDDVERQEAELNALILSQPFAGMATRMMWSPTARGQSHPSWMLITVERSLWTPAQLSMYVPTDQREWFRIANEHMPWVAASTAGALRNALLDRKPLVLRNKLTVHPDLLKPVQETVRDGRRPPTDDNGLL